MSGGLRPGEIELSDDTPPPVVVAADPEPEPEPIVAAPEPEPEPIVEPEPEPEKPKATGMLAELIETRRIAKENKQRADAYEADLREGRLSRAEPKPAVNVAEVERAELQATAERLRLVTTDTDGKQVWDLDAAKRVKDEISSGARAAVAPIQHSLTMKDAQANVAVAVAHATAQKLPEKAIDYIRNGYTEMLAQPNGAQMLADPKVATAVWHSKIGEALALGLLSPGEAVTKETKPAVAAPATGRRGGGAAVQLSAQVQKVYKDNNLDPGKAFTSRSKVEPDAQGAYSLED